jgi:hypothetical protein
LFRLAIIFIPLFVGVAEALGIVYEEPYRIPTLAQMQRDRILIHTRMQESEEERAGRVRKINKDQEQVISVCHH